MKIKTRAEMMNHAQAYKGYLITHNPICDEWYVSKGGQHIAGFKDKESAIEAINDVTGLD